MTDIAPQGGSGLASASQPPSQAQHILAGLTKDDQRVIRRFTLQLIYSFLAGGTRKDKWVKLADASPFSGNDDTFASRSNMIVFKSTKQDREARTELLQLTEMSLIPVPRASLSAVTAKQYILKCKSGREKTAYLRAWRGGDISPEKPADGNVFANNTVRGLANLMRIKKRIWKARQKSENKDQNDTAPRCRPWYTVANEITADSSSSSSSKSSSSVLKTSSVSKLSAEQVRQEAERQTLRELAYKAGSQPHYLLESDNYRTKYTTGLSGRRMQAVIACFASHIRNAARLTLLPGSDIRAFIAAAGQQAVDINIVIRNAAADDGCTEGDQQGEEGTASTNTKRKRPKWWSYSSGSGAGEGNVSSGADESITLQRLKERWTKLAHVTPGTKADLGMYLEAKCGSNDRLVMLSRLRASPLQKRSIIASVLREYADSIGYTHPDGQHYNTNQLSVGERLFARAGRHMLYPGVGKPVPPTLGIRRLKMTDEQILAIVTGVRHHSDRSSWGSKMLTTSDGTVIDLERLIRHSSLSDTAQAISKTMRTPEEEEATVEWLQKKWLQEQDEAARMWENGPAAGAVPDIDEMHGDAAGNSSNSGAGDEAAAISSALPIRCKCRNRDGLQCLKPTHPKGERCRFVLKGVPSKELLEQAIKHITADQRMARAAQSNVGTENGRENFAAMRSTIVEIMTLLNESKARRQLWANEQHATPMGSAKDLGESPKRPRPPQVMSCIDTLNGSSFDEQGKYLVARSTLLEAYAKGDYPSSLQKNHRSCLLCISHMLDADTKVGGAPKDTYNKLTCEGHSHNPNNVFIGDDASLAAAEWLWFAADYKLLLEVATALLQEDADYEDATKEYSSPGVKKDGSTGVIESSSGGDKPTSAVAQQSATVVQIALDNMCCFQDEGSKQLRRLKIYRGWVVRKEWEKRQDKKQLQHMPPTRALLVLDWKMKLLASYYRMKSSECSWCRRECCARGRDINDGDMQMYFIDMMTDDSTQDKVAVCNITQQTMRIISEKFPHLEEIDILSDGASCYK
eukprot:g1977.t1